MKNKFLILFLVFSTKLCIAQNFNFSPIKYIDYVHPNQTKNFIYKDSDVIFCASYDSQNKIKFDINYPGNYLRKISEKNDSGYPFYSYKLQDGTPYRDYLLEGKGIIVTFQTEDKNIEKKSLTDYQKWKANFWKKTKYDLSLREYGPTSENGCGVWIYDDGISSINSSSFLSEQNDIYSATNLKDKIYVETSIEDMNYSYDSITPPWVEGVKGYGIGEWLDIEFKYKSDEIQILNGFVDFRRMYLYKENSRLKRVLIESENPKFAKEYDFEDVVKYNVIKLPAETNKIRITIKEVFRGDKYDDTCISSILVTDKTKSDFETQRKAILENLKSNGILKQLEEFKKN